MTLNKKLEFGPDRRGEWIEELAQLASAADVINRLREIAGAYGKVMAVSEMASIAHRGEDIDLYRVCFERTVDAMAASRDLNCYLLGFSTLVVQIRPQGGRRARPPLPGDGLADGREALPGADRRPGRPLAGMGEEIFGSAE